VRKKAGHWEIGLSMMFTELPAEPMDPVARLKLVAAETQRIKEAAEPQALVGSMSKGDLLRSDFCR
jgi:hypothetical protein